MLISPAHPSSIRFATFNASLNRSTQGQLIGDLSTPNHTQARTVAEIIQRVNPDVLLINEFDYDASGVAAQLFQHNYLAVAQGISGNQAADALIYPYVYVAPSNTGIHSGFDLDNNGVVVSTPETPGYAGDAWGFGNFPGQFGMVVYSKYPIVGNQVRTFQNFRWQDMPDALLPTDWYTPEELARFPLSSKSHWDIPIDINETIVHILVSHPTPPVFDGLEERNSRRNHDEIRFWSDYITPGRGSYIYDDNGQFGGLSPNAHFVIMGDQNADPIDGNSQDKAILQLLDNPSINTSVTPSSEGGPEDAILQGQANNNHLGNPTFDTSRFNPIDPGNLRVDYVLPSQSLTITNCGVFWPTTVDPLYLLVANNISSDHRLVFVDVSFVPEPRSTSLIYKLSVMGEIHHS